MPDGEKQDRCPRRFIKEDAGWWSELISCYNAYQQGILPHTGGLSDQPALYPHIMSIIHSALDDEQEYKRVVKKKKDDLVSASQQQVAAQQTVLRDSIKPS